MTTETRNEAAERLCVALHAGCVRYHERISGMGLTGGAKTLHDPTEHLREAEELLPVLDAERRATVERIREAVKQASFWESWLISVDRTEFLAILDEEAAR